MTHDMACKDRSLLHLSLISYAVNGTPSMDSTALYITSLLVKGPLLVIICTPFIKVYIKDNKNVTIKIKDCLKKMFYIVAMNIPYFL